MVTLCPVSRLPITPSAQVDDGMTVWDRLATLNHRSMTFGTTFSSAMSMVDQIGIAISMVRRFGNDTHEQVPNAGLWDRFSSPIGVGVPFSADRVCYATGL
jgi:hypothetical protein